MATGQFEASVEEKGKRSELGTVGGSFSVARDINNRGEIVGRWESNGGSTPAASTKNTAHAHSTEPRCFPVPILAAKNGTRRNGVYHPILLPDRRSYGLGLAEAMTGTCACRFPWFKSTLSE